MAKSLTRPTLHAVSDQTIDARDSRRLPALAMVIVLLFPLAWLPQSWLDPAVGDTPRRLLLLACLGVGMAIIALAWARQRRIDWQPHPLDRTLPLLLIALLAAGIFGAYPRASFFSAVWKDDNSLLLWLIALACYGYLRAIQPTRLHVERMLTLFAGAGGAAALIGLLEHGFHLGMYPAPMWGRVAATFGNAMFAGTFFALALPVAGAVLAVCRARAIQVLMSGSILLMLAALVLTQTRGAWIGFLLGLGVLLVIAAGCRRDAMRRVVRRYGLFVIILVIAILALIAGNRALRARAVSMVDLRDATVQTRLLYMRAGGEMLLARPLTGWGPNTFMTVFPQYRPSANLREGVPINRDYMTALPHNLTVQLAAESGILGLLAFAFCLVVIARTTAMTLRAGDDPLVWGVLGSLLVYGITAQFAWDIAATLPAAFALLALLTTLSPPRPARSITLTVPHARVLRGGAYLLAGLTCVFLVQNIAVISLQHIGALHITHLEQQLDPRDSGARQHAVYAAISAYSRAIAWTPVRDVSQYKFLFDAYKLQIGLGTESDIRAGYDGMRSVADQTLAMMDRDWEIRRKLCIFYTAMEQYAEARRMIEPLLTFEPHSGEVWYLYARTLAGEGRMADAVTAATRAVELDPENEAFTALLREYRP